MTRTPRALLVLLALAAIVAGAWYATRSVDEGESAADSEALAAGSVEPGTELVAQTGETGEALATPEARAGERQTAEGAASLEDGKAVPGETQRLTGRVVLQPGTPADERVVVMAVAKPMKARALYGSLAEMAWDPEAACEGDLQAAAEVDEGGFFELALPADLRATHLALTGRYSYSKATVPVALPAEAPRQLVAELGGWVTGRSLPPPNPTQEESDFEDVEAEMGPDITGEFDPLDLDVLAIDRDVELSPDGRFEFRGVPNAIASGIVVKHEHLATHLELGVAPEPGEHLHLDLQMVRGATLSGRVVDEDGRPVAEAEVAALYRGILGKAIDELRETETLADGTFVLANVALGKLELVAKHDEFRDGKLKLESELADGRTLSGLEVVLERGGTVAGTVRFPEGDPVEGELVRVTPDLSQLGGLEAMNIATAGSGSDRTDADGRFAVPGLGESVKFNVKVTVKVDEGEREGRWAATVKGAVPGGEPLELVLESLVDLAGRVVDVADEPVPKFQVFATLAGSGGMFGIGAERKDWTFEEEDGRFTIEGLSPATWEVFAVSAGFAKSEVQELTVPLPETAEPIVFVLPPSSSAAGVVLDTAGAPVAGAKVEQDFGLAERIERMQSGDIPSVYSDAEGQFLVEDLNPGSLAFIATAEGFAASAPVPCEALPGERTDGLVLQLRMGGTLTGELLGEEGEPDPGKRVMVQATPSYKSQHMLKTDGDGRFEVEHLEPGTWQVVAMGDFMGGETDDQDLASMLGNLKMEMVDIADGEAVHVVLGKLPESPVTVHGRVKHSGEPVEQAIVSFVPEDAQGLGSLKMTFTDADGAYETVLDQSGAYLVTVQKAVEAGQQSSIEYLERVPEDAEEVTLDFDLPHGRISGLVRGPNGAPLAGCRVTLNVDDGISYGSFLGGNYTETVTDANGEYDIPYLRPGTYSVAAGGTLLGGMFGDGKVTGAREIQSGLTVGEGEWRSSVDFRLRAPGQLVGFVRAADGSPAVDATVFVRDGEGRPIERFSLYTTDAAGRFEYKGLAPGEYTISARTGDQASGESERVAVSEGGVAEAHVTLAGGTILRIVVVDNSDEELRARIQVVDSEGREMTGMLSMSEVMESFGSGFSSKEQRVGPVPPGTYRITATTDDGRRASKPVTLKGQEERKLKLRLK